MAEIDLADTRTGDTMMQPREYSTEQKGRCNEANALYEKEHKAAVEAKDQKAYDAAFEKYKKTVDAIYDEVYGVAK